MTSDFQNRPHRQTPDRYRVDVGDHHRSNRDELCQILGETGPSTLRRKGQILCSSQRVYSPVSSLVVSA